MKDFSKDLLSGHSTGKSLTPTGNYAAATHTSCYSTHPKLKIGGGTFVGGSCSCPVVSDADVYIGLDWNMKTHGGWPWETSHGPTAIDVSYPITDYQAPKDSDSFIAMVDWICNQLQEGKTVHAGCIGGHGRTGTLLSAVVAVFEKQGKLDLGKLKGDAITWTRKNYCEKAVESSGQVDFLMKHFGCKKVAGAKAPYVGGGYAGTQTYGNSGSGKYKGAGGSIAGTNLSHSISCVPGTRLIWEKIAKTA